MSFSIYTYYTFAANFSRSIVLFILINGSFRNGYVLTNIFKSESNP